MIGKAYIGTKRIIVCILAFTLFIVLGPVSFNSYAAVADRYWRNTIHMTMHGDKASSFYYMMLEPAENSHYRLVTEICALYFTVYIYTGYELNEPVLCAPAQL